MFALINQNLFKLHPINLVKLLKQRFLDNSELLFSRKQQLDIYYMLLTISYSESAYPITPVEY